jgi:hypothetical protein
MNTKGEELTPVDARVSAVTLWLDLLPPPAHMAMSHALMAPWIPACAALSLTRTT